MEVLRRYHQGFDAHDLASAGLSAVMTAKQVVAVRELIKQVIVEDGILNYIARLNAASRQSPDIVLGASARAATHVLLACKTLAALQGRDYVVPDDVKFILPHVYRHRILLKPEAEIEGLDADAVIQRLLGQVEVPGNRCIPLSVVFSSFNCRACHGARCLAPRHGMGGLGLRAACADPVHYGLARGRLGRAL